MKWLLVLLILPIGVKAQQAKMDSMLSIMYSRLQSSKNSLETVYRYLGNGNTSSNRDLIKYASNDIVDAINTIREVRKVIGECNIVTYPYIQTNYKYEKEEDPLQDGWKYYDFYRKWPYYK